MTYAKQDFSFFSSKKLKEAVASIGAEAQGHLSQYFNDILDLFLMINL